MGGKIQIMQITLGEPESKIHKHTKTQKHKYKYTKQLYEKQKAKNTHTMQDLSIDILLLQGY